MIASAFTMDVYCDAEGCKSSASFVHDDNFRGAKKEARQRGWHFYDDDTKVLCKTCAIAAGHKPVRRRAQMATGVSIFALGK